MNHDERTNSWGKLLGVATGLWIAVQAWQVSGSILASLAVAVFVTPFIMLALTPIYYIAASLLALIHLPKKD